MHIEAIHEAENDAYAAIARGGEIEALPTLTVTPPSTMRNGYYGRGHDSDIH